MRSQGLPSSFLPAHLGINYHPPPPRCPVRGLHVRAHLTRSRRSARRLVDPRFPCSKCEVELSYRPRSLPYPSSYVLSLNLLTSVSLPHERDMCSMLLASTERADGALPSSSR